MFSDVWSALTLSEERCASLTCNWSICTFFSSTSCCAFPPAQHVERNMFCHICILFVKCSSDTREDACNYTTDWYNFLHWHVILFLLSTDFPSFSSDDFPFPSLVAFEFGAGEDVHSFCLRSSLPLPEALTPWWKPTRVSFRTLSSCLPLPAISHFPFKRWLYFPFDSVSLLLHESYRFGLWGSDFSSSGQKTSSLMFLILNILFVLRFAPFLDHTEPTQSATEQNTLILTSTILPGPYPKVGSSADHSALIPSDIEKSWTSSFWRRIVNKSESPCADS